MMVPLAVILIGFGVPILLTYWLDIRAALRSRKS